MEIPPEALVRFLIIADNPEIEIPGEIEPLIDNKRVLLFRNPENFGVCKTRNIGIGHAQADWLLFLDDDVIPSKNLLITYVNAIKQDDASVGFFGDVVFPHPANSFTNGIKASGMLSLFSVPKQNTLRKWTPTANVIVKRNAIGDVRFKEIFAKAGAGEEIDFFLNIYKHTSRDLKGIQDAQVYHDWWYNGKRTYSRFIRWNTGVALLPGIFPGYAYYNFPNMLESLLLVLPLTIFICLFIHSFLPLFCVLAGIFIGECFVEFLRLLYTKGISQSKFVIEVVLIRAANDLGKITRLFKTPLGICRRFNLSCDVKNIASQRLWAGLKFIAFIAFSVGLYYILKPLNI